MSSSSVATPEDFLREGLNVGLLQKSRERNREHARRTRLRKKAHLEGLKGKLAELQNEASSLTRKMEESNTANILLRMSSKLAPDDNSTVGGSSIEEESFLKGNLVDYIRTLVRTEANQVRVDSSKCSSDTTDKEKTDGSDEASDSGCFDENYDDDDAKDKESVVDLDGLRKERNRMNAKLTRDRKKIFTTRIQQMIQMLERQNIFMKNRISNMEQSEGNK